MPLVVKIPENASVISASGSYPRALNVLDRRETAVQRKLRSEGLAGYEPLTQAVLLALAQRASKGGAFLDVGAHIGLYSALVDSIFGGKV